MPCLFQEGPGWTTRIIHLKDSNQQPIWQRAYRISECLVSPLKEEIKNMLELGVIEPSESEWSSPMVMVPKKDGTQRPCVDFRKLNAVSQFDANPIP
ncbi:hypothetical protein LDENG_00192630 [Lucifuga dentata]|nr:hypothetical protein LDENG_00192630 [Lucifuga dentata]